MKILNILIAQKRFDELTEEIKAFSALRNDMGDLIGHSDVGYKILDKCRDKLEEKRKALVKERRDLEVEDEELKTVYESI